MAHLAVALPGPRKGGCSLCPAPYSQAGVKSSGKALKGKCFSDGGPEIALPSPTLISSCLASQLYFRNKHLLALFTLQPDSRSALRLCFPELVASGHWGRGQKSPRGPSQVSRHWCLSRTGRGTSDWWPDLWSSSPTSLGSGYTHPQLQLRITSIVTIIAQASGWCRAIYKALSPTGSFGSAGREVTGQRETANEKPAHTVCRPPRPAGPRDWRVISPEQQARVHTAGGGPGPGAWV